jgi:hypothetical protein
MKKIAEFKEPFICRHPSHNPPNMIVLSPGIYEHTCPGCNKTQTVVVRPGPTL